VGDPAPLLSTRRRRVGEINPPDGPAATANDDVRGPSHTIEIDDPFVIEGDTSARIRDPFGVRDYAEARVQMENEMDTGDRIRRYAREHAEPIESWGRTLLGATQRGMTGGLSDELAAPLGGLIEYARRRHEGEHVSPSDIPHLAREFRQQVNEETNRGAREHPTAFALTDFAASLPRYMRMPMASGVGGMIASTGLYAGLEGAARAQDQTDDPGEVMRESGTDALAAMSLSAVPVIGLEAAAALRLARAQARLRPLERRLARNDRVTPNPSDEVPDEYLGGDEAPSATAETPADLLAPVQSEADAARSAGRILNPRTALQNAIRVDPDVQRLRSIGQTTIPQMGNIERLPGGIERASELLDEAGILRWGQMDTEENIVNRLLEARERSGSAVRRIEEAFSERGLTTDRAATVQALRAEADRVAGGSGSRAEQQAAYLRSEADKLEARLPHGPLLPDQTSIGTPVGESLDDMRGFDADSAWNRNMQGEPPGSVAGAQFARRQIRRQVQDAVGRGAPDLARDYAIARERFQYFSRLAPNGVARALLARAHTPAGITGIAGTSTGASIGAGIGNALAGTPGMMAGSAAGAAAGYAGTRTWRQVGPSVWARMYGGAMVPTAELAAEVARLRRVAETTPEMFGRFERIAAAAAANQSDEAWDNFIETLTRDPEGVQVLNQASSPNELDEPPPLIEETTDDIGEPPPL
jgi:hypothetical protein